VKILDFGLAKLIERAEGDDTGITETLKPHTEQGTILGTVAYMSPEQAEGRNVDARSDIFSFGSVLYELVTRRQPFQRATKMSTLSAILQSEPPPASSFTRDMPIEVERIIARCLRKDPARRTQHIVDVKLALEDLKEESDSGKLRSLRTPIRATTRRAWIPIVLGCAIALAALGIWLKMSWKPAKPSQGSFLTRLTSDSGLTTDPALSPDGKLLCYASDRSGEGNLDLWVQQIAGGEPIRLTHQEGDDHEPSFSPDGSKVVFRSERDGGGIYVTSTFGGEARLIVRQGRRPRFSPDGAQIAYWVGRDEGDLYNRNTGRIYVASASGGLPQQLQSEFVAARYPVWLPDGKHILFIGSHLASSPQEPWDWWVTPLDHGQPIKTGVAAVLRKRGLSGFVVPADWAREAEGIVFSAGLADSTNIWRIPISTANWLVSGDPVRVTFGTISDGNPSVASGGKLAFASLNRNLDVWTLPIHAATGKVLGSLTQVTTDASDESGQALSTDGKKLVYLSNKSGNRDVWIKDLLTGRQTALTTTQENEQLARLSSDGTTVGYNVISTGSKQAPLYTMPASGGVAEKIFENCLNWNWSSDTKRILHVISPPPTIYLFNVQSGQDREYIRHPKYNLYMPAFSPDDRWIAFHAGLDGNRSRIFVVPYRESGPVPEIEWIPITDGSAADRNVEWSPDGASIYFVSNRHGYDCLWTGRLDSSTKRPIGTPVPVHDFHTARLTLKSAVVSTNKAAITAVELTGNIWMTSLSLRQ
jgi:Tol biopolymer transport system component